VESTVDLLHRVESVCRNDLPAKALRERLLEVISRRIPYDGHVFALTDPVTRITTSPHADIPGLPWDQLPGLIRSRYLTGTNRPDRMLGGPARSVGLPRADAHHSGLRRQ
jgi:hypothetical protein